MSAHPLRQVDDAAPLDRVRARSHSGASPGSRGSKSTGKGGATLLFSPRQGIDSATLSLAAMFPSEFRQQDFQQLFFGRLFRHSP